MQPVICLLGATLTARKFISRKSFRVTWRAGQFGSFSKKLSRMFVVVVLLSIKPGHRFVKLRTIRVVLDPALQKIFSELEIFALSFDAECESWLTRIIHRGGTRVPGHVPCRHVPE